MNKDEMMKVLLEGENTSFDAPYNREEDKDAPEQKFYRKKVLRICDIDRLKRIRNQEREEMAQDSVFVPYIYGPQESGEPSGGLGL